MDYDINVIDKIQELGYDLSEITSEQEMNLKMAIRQLADVAFMECHRLAKERLHTKLKDYEQALKFMPAGTDGYRIELEGDMVEYDEGFEPFNLKPGLLHGPHAKVSEKGVPYNIVPIKASPEAGGKTEFRIVTGNSPASSWIHPGFQGVHILDDVFDMLDSEIENVINDILGG